MHDERTTTTTINTMADERTMNVAGDDGGEAMRDDGGDDDVDVDAVQCNDGVMQ